jgi:Methyltransferase domain
MKEIDTKTEVGINKLYNESYTKNRNRFEDLLFKSPIPSEELFNNIGLFIDRRNLSRFLFINELYQKIVPIHGSIFELGVRYGQNISLLTSYRGIYEPYNHNRKIIGFDTWEGFVDVDKDKDKRKWKSGDFGVPENYEDFLDEVISLHEKMAPISSIKKHQLIKGNASQTVEQYLKDHPETIISLAYFDFDIYKPTRDCLELILPYLSKGAVIAFDEINVKEFPGETQALREILGTNNFKIHHSPFRANAGYVIY